VHLHRRRKRLVAADLLWNVFFSHWNTMTSCEGIPLGILLANGSTRCWRYSPNMW
jgi:hypothetical protein